MLQMCYIVILQQVEPHLLPIFNFKVMKQNPLFSTPIGGSYIWFVRKVWTDVYISLGTFSGSYKTKLVLTVQKEMSSVTY